MILARRRKERVLRFCDRCLVGCKFQVQKFKGDGRITYNGPWFNNLVLDVGLDALASRVLGHASTCIGRYVNVGTSSAIPSEEQSGLQSHLASTNETYGSTLEGYSTGDPIHRWSQKTHEFAIGTCTGNLTEVGLSYAPNSTYFNRQLFRDELGDPTTISVLEDEGLRVTSKLFVYGDLQPGETVEDSFTLETDDDDSSGGSTITTTREMTSDASTSSWLRSNDYVGELMAPGYQDNRYSPAISADTETFEGTTCSSVTALAYTPGNFYRDFEAVWNAGRFVGNIATVSFFYYPSRDTYYGKPFTAFRLDPVIPLAETEQITITLRRAWGRYDDSSGA